MRAEPVKLGIIGCGNISDAYLNGAARSDLVTVAAVADLVPEVACTKAAAHGGRAEGVEALLADTEIAIVINLTIPAVHAEVSLQAIEAGKHVYSEKPLAINLEDGQRIMQAADEKGAGAGHCPLLLGRGVGRGRAARSGRNAARDRNPFSNRHSQV